MNKKTIKYKSIFDLCIIILQIIFLKKHYISSVMMKKVSDDEKSQ